MDKADRQKLLWLTVACGALVVLSTTAVSAKKVATPWKPPLPPSGGGTTSPAPAPAPKPTPAPVPSTPGTPSSEVLTKRLVAAIYRQYPARLLSPQATRELATAVVAVCLAENYPLDLAFGQMCMESKCLLNAYNPSSRATGPFQVTPVAAAQVNVAWPLTTATQKVRAGVRYMKWLRSTYSECGASVKTTLQHYGMGRGNWLKYRATACTNACKSSISVIKAECGCGHYGAGGYSLGAMNMAKLHPELKTVSWWG